MYLYGITFGWHCCLFATISCEFAVSQTSKFLHCINKRVQQHLPEEWKRKTTCHKRTSLCCSWHCSTHSLALKPNLTAFKFVVLWRWHTLTCTYGTLEVLFYKPSTLCGWSHKVTSSISIWRGLSLSSGQRSSWRFQQGLLFVISTPISNKPSCAV